MRSTYQVSELIKILAKDPMTEHAMTSKGRKYFIATF